MYFESLERQLPMARLRSLTSIVSQPELISIPGIDAVAPR